MNFVSRQAAIGVFIAVALMLGASASPEIQSGMPSPGALTSSAHITLSYREAGACLAAALQACRDKVLDVALDHALDAFGQIAAHLKQV